MRQLRVIRDKQAFSAAEVGREEYLFWCGLSPGMFWLIPCLSLMTSEISHGSLLTARFRTRLLFCRLPWLVGRWYNPCLGFCFCFFGRYWFLGCILPALSSRCHGNTKHVPFTSFPGKFCIFIISINIVDSKVSGLKLQRVIVRIFFLLSFRGSRNLHKTWTCSPASLAFDSRWRGIEPQWWR